MKAEQPKAHKDEELKWQAESDVRTLVEALAIRADSERMKRAMKFAKEQKANLSKAMEEAKQDD